jgi:hypothetical protein
MQQGKPFTKMGSIILLSSDDESILSFCKVIHNRLKWDEERYKEEYFDNIKKFDASTGKIYGYQQLISYYKMYLKENFLKFQQLFVKEI